MTVNYTTNLALGQPVTGTESGTWGDDVNNAVTSYLDIAIAGGLSVTVTTADVTLTLTQGTSVATNIGSTTAQYAILNVSGAMTAARNLILPSSSRQYVINNACTGGFLLTVKGSATTGVTLVNGEKAHVFWNGTDYAKLSNAPGGAGTFSSITNTGLTATRVVFSTTNGLETDSANLTFDGTNLTLAGGTANGVTYLNGSKVLTSGSALTFDGTNFATTGSISSTIASKTAQFNAAGGSIYASFADGTKTWRFGAGIQSAGTISLYNATDAVTAYTVDATGNVGIGTSSPTFSLDVRGDGQKARFGNTTIGCTAGTYVSGTLWGFSNNGGNGGMFGDASTYVYFATAGAERMRIDSSGNVGIGTSSPAYPLQVRRSGGTGSVGITIDNVAGVANRTTQYFAVGDSTSDTTGHAFYTRAATASDVLRLAIDSSGNVGIGTTSITTNQGTGLIVGNSSGGNISIGTNGQAGGSTPLFTDLSFRGFSNSETARIRGLDNSGTVAQGVLQFYTASLVGSDITERMRIDSSGNVGIGTSSPVSKLQLTGASQAATSLTMFYSAIQAGSIGITSGGAMAFGLDGSTGTTERMRIDSSGNVGIGVTNPNIYGKLATVATAASTAFYAGSSTQGVYISNSTGTDVVYNSSGSFAGAHVWQTGNVERARLDTSGNLLVGTTSNYVGETNWVESKSGYVFAANNTGSANNRNWIISPNGSAAGSLDFIYSSTNTGWPNAAYAMSIDSSGNLLVGKTSDTNSAAGVVVANSSGSSGLVKCSKTASGIYNALLNYHNGTYIGGVDYSNTATSFPTSSDIRLKKDIVDAGSAYAKIDQIRIVSHGWKHDDEVVEFGVIAQELNLVAPQAVTVGDDGEEIEKTWGVDYSKLIPMLVKAIQEQQALITSLTARITALEST